jgi:hypothetical protein
MRKSIPIREYRKKALPFDSVTDGKSIENVEDLVYILKKKINYILYYFFFNFKLNKKLVLEKYFI